MTANQVIVLLDVHRGFDKTRHLGTVDEDVIRLMNADLIRPWDEAKAFPYKLTARGATLVERLLEQADLR